MLQFFKKSGQRDRVSEGSPGKPRSSERNASDVCANRRPSVGESSPVCGLEEEEEEEDASFLEASYSHSRLSKTLSEILADKGALGYFIQFMESRGRLALIKFWMEVECICGCSYKEDDPNGSEHADQNYNRPEAKLRGRNLGRESNLNEPKTTSVKQDASRIYRKYIASDLLPVSSLSREVKAEVEEALTCRNVEPLISCLASVQRLVYKTLEDEYINDFLRSDFHCKHQIDVLTSGDVKLADILNNETAFFFFMEFVDLENKRELLDFWMTAVNYKRNLTDKRGDVDPSEAQTDALIIYDKYFSLQATVPLGFSDKIRFQVEQNICREGGDGPQPDCFDRPCVIVYNFLSKHYLPAFLSSQLYYKYLSELIGTIQSGACAGLPHPRIRRAGSDCSSEVSTLSIGTQDTAASVATTTTTASHNEGSRLADNENTRNNNLALNIDTSQLYDPDSLWRRTKSTLSVGYVDDMGRFVTEIEPDPRRKYESRLSRAVKRFIHIEQDKEKEELAWKIAEMIVREITSLTLGGRDAST